MTAQVATLELSHALAIELHGLFRALERRIHAPDRVREQLDAASRKLEELLAAEWNLVPEAVAESVERVAELLDGWSLDDVETWSELKVQLREAYTALSTALRHEQVQVPALRPTNYTRSIFHMLSALACLGLLLVLDPWQLPLAAAAFAGSAWIMETVRHRSPRANDGMMMFFGPIAHEHERDRINSGTWYMTALVLLSLTFSPLLCVIAVAVLGFADPFAALIGRRWGRVRLVNNRSLEGTLTFVVVGTLAARAAMELVTTEASSGALWVVALGAAIAGALTELYSRRIDDNFSIPIVSGGAAALMMALLGISLWG
ncbi:MAG: diacylglycerol/polyprenol kinase family protein [Myxococcota bacterium]